MMVNMATPEQERKPEQEPVLPAADSIQAGEPTPSDVGLAPRPSFANDGTGSEKFAMHMQEFAREDAEDLAKPGMNIQEYLKRMYERDEREYQALKAYENDPELSADQREMMNNRIKTLDYNRETRELQEQYMANPDDPEIAARYNQRQGELKEFRELMQNSEEFKDNEHMVRMRELETKLGAAESMDAQNAVKLEMAEEMRGFKRDLLNQGEEGLDKIISFTDHNRGNKVIQESGMLDTIETIKKQRDAERGTDELENGHVTPGDTPKSGGVISNDPEAARVAEGEAGRPVDDQQGGIAPVRYESQQATLEQSEVKQVTPGQTSEEQAAGRG